MNELSVICDMPKILSTRSKVLPNPEYSTGGHTIAKDTLMNDPMCSRSLSSLKISFIVCPSRVTIGTVWCGHKGRQTISDYIYSNFCGLTLPGYLVVMQKKKSKMLNISFTIIYNEYKIPMNFYF